ESFYSAQLDVTGNLHSRLGLACRASPACFQKLVDNVWDILALMERLDWTTEHDRVATQIAPLVAADTRKHYTNADVSMYQEDMRFFVSERRLWLTMML